ncbi:hypothetical protein [Amycolatopsis panacis]|uniref:hypothetical protein n=1 Tax=Amycolatopsis panacis TaxID=2340917 RepID=UPI0026CA6442
MRSLREGTRAEALRTARTCYDHLTGKLGVMITTALLEQGALVTLDGEPTTRRRETGRFSAPLQEHPYELGPRAPEVLDALGVDLARVRTSRRPLLGML